jgi:hypothetical protein
VILPTRPNQLLKHPIRIETENLARLQKKKQTQKTVKGMIHLSKTVRDKRQQGWSTLFVKEIHGMNVINLRLFFTICQYILNAD